MVCDPSNPFPLLSVMLLMRPLPSKVTLAVSDRSSQRTNPEMLSGVNPVAVGRNKRGFIAIGVTLEG